MGFDNRSLMDAQGRRFPYVRLSITEICNFRCAYCLPDGWKKTGPLHFLRPEEIGRLASALTEVGVGKVRLTGGEPSVRKDLPEILATLAAVPGMAKIAMTTNGWNLERRSASWRESGLTHLNVSVDALDADAFHRITGHDRLSSVLRGIDDALARDYASVKLNAVLLRETAEKGFADWARFVKDRPVAVRFIELMRTADNADYFAAHHVSGAGLRGWLTERGWTPLQRRSDDGPAVEFVHADHRGRIGLIAPYAPGFCDSCNRLRVTARGKLRLCLFGEGGVDLRDLLQAPDDRSELVHRIHAALYGKAAGHRLHQGLPGDLRNLAELGG